MTLQNAFRYLFFGLWLGLLAAGCAMMEVRTSGQGEAIRWHATDFRNYVVATDEGEIYEYTLVLEEQRGATVTFTALQARFQNNPQSLGNNWEQAGQWVLPAGGELRIPLGTRRYCASERCRNWGPLAPVWHLVLIGTDGHGRPVREVLEIRLPYAAETS